MSELGEGIGGAIEGALAGRAVEPAHGEGGHGASDSATCRNCGTALIGPHCHKCGQSRQIHRTISAIGHDLMHGVLHLDGKLWRTLPMLAFRPGKLTRRYIDGERAKFVSPMAMFLFSVFAMFAVFQMVGLTVPTDVGSVTPAQIERTMDAQLDKIDTRIAEIDAQLAQAELPRDDRAALETERRELVDAKEGLAKITALPAQARGSDRDRAERADVWDIFDENPDGDAGLSVAGIESIDKGLVQKWREHPELMLYKLQANGYKFSWLLIPLSIPFVWLTFAWRRRFRAYDHAIFVTYSLSFMSLLFIAMSLLALVPEVGPVLALLLLCTPPLHLYKQLRGAYELSRFSALWRLFVLSGFIWVVAVLFLQALFLIGAF